MSFDTSFERVQKDIENIIPKLVKNSKVAANHNGDENTYFADKIKQNKEKILIGLAYLDRMYNFNIGNTNIKDIILDTPGYFGGTVDLLDWIISIGGSGGDTLKISNNKDAYIKLFRGKITNSNSIIDFLETSVNKLAPGTTMDGLKMPAKHLLWRLHLKKILMQQQLYILIYQKIVLWKSIIR